MAVKYEKGTFVTVPNKNALKGQSAVLQVLFSWICSFADENGQCWPSRSTLAKNAGIGLKTVDRHLKILEELGFIVKETRKNGAKNITNIYQIMIIDGVASQIPQRQPDARVASERPHPSVTDTLGVASQTTHQLNTSITNTNEVNLSIREKSEPESPETLLAKSFGEVWSLYPVKKSKMLAERNWFRLDPSLELIKTITQDIQQRVKNDRQWIEGYIPHLSTYLNQQRWTDEISKPRETPNNLDPGTPYIKGKYAGVKSIII